ncbi:MAG: hypothetical protein ACR2MN_14600 [Acidimicrobiales bacterium]
MTLLHRRRADLTGEAWAIALRRGGDCGVREHDGCMRRLGQALIQADEDGAHIGILQHQCGELTAMLEERDRLIHQLRAEAGPVAA